MRRCVYRKQLDRAGRVRGRAQGCGVMRMHQNARHDAEFCTTMNDGRGDAFGGNMPLNRKTALRRSLQNLLFSITEM